MMEAMSDLAWNSITLEEEEKPRISPDELRQMAQDLDPDDYDDDVRHFLDELMQSNEPGEFRQAATLLLQDEVDLAPDLAAMGVEPDEALIALLLAAGADPNARNPHGQPPLHLAAFYGYEHIIDMLLAAGANKRQRNHAGRLAAEVAATPTLAKRLMPPGLNEQEEAPLPPEIEDADNDHCSCGHQHQDGDGCHHTGCNCHHHG